MKISLARLGLNGKLALLAFLLGALAVFGNPYGGGKVTLRTQELATLVHNEVDHVTAQDLADWIIQGRSDYRLIDLRAPQDYAAYHIPPAENLPITDLPGDLERNEKIVLYSDGGIHAAQAWFLLQAEGYGASYILKGGLEEWQDRILYPTLPANASPEQLAAFERDRQVSVYFGGTPRLAGPESATALAPAPPAITPPKVRAPAAPTGAAQAKKKKKEGC